MVAIYHWVVEEFVPFGSIAHILDYLWEEELKDYEASESAGHTFEHLAKVANWLNGRADWPTLDYIRARDASVGTGWRVSATHYPADCRWAPKLTEICPKGRAAIGGKTLDVTEQAKAAGLTCPVAVTALVWEKLIAGDNGFLWKNEEENLAYLLRKVAHAHDKKGRDVYALLRAVDGRGEPKETSIKALSCRGEDGTVRLTIMMMWEVGR
jgi:hypothetical protein